MAYSTLLCLFALFSLALSQKTFYATSVSISNVPNMKGALSASIYYDSTAGMMKTIYDVGVTEIHNFTDKVLYKKCGATCEAESISYGDFGFYTPFTGETPANTSIISCDSGVTGSTFSRKATNPYAVSLIAFDTSGQVCKAKLVNGETFTFKSFGSGTTTWSTTGCPKKTCAQQLDMMLVMDESNSISTTEWASMKSFVVNFTNAFTIGENAAKIGIVSFAATAKLRYPYQNDQQSFRNTMNKLTRYYSLSTPPGTVTGTALDTTYSAYKNYARQGGVKHITVVITDGKCTCKESVITTAAAPLKTSTVGYVFAVGVKGADVSELNNIASGTNGTATINGINVQTSFFVSDWTKLESILNTLIAATCTDFAGNPCGSSCKGFCGCNQTCICPDDCSGYTDTCNTGMCSKTANGAGCYASAKPDPCNDNNACTNEYCTNDQCIRTNVTCPDKPCYTKKCDPKDGCVYAAKVCVDSNPCTDEFCNVTTNKCDYTSRTRPCAACQAYNLTSATCSVGKSLCEKWDCVQNGSLANCTKISDVSCDDLNACTIDSCDPAKGCVHTLRSDCDDGDMCTDDSCDTVSGCVYTTFNVTDRCDDLNACTIDSCNATVGCVHTEIVCNTTDPCRDSVCNPVSGCELQYKNCAEEPGIREKLGDCYAAFCNDGSGLVNVTDDTNTLGCYLDLQPGSTVDNCGVCNGDGTTCGFPLTVAQVAGISAGLVGGVVAGAVAFAAIGAFGAKKGYDAYMRNKNNMNGAQANPMYNDNGRSGQNPMYEMT